MSLNKLECFKKVETIKLVETICSIKKISFEDTWLEDQEFEFSKRNISTIYFSLKEAKLVMHEIPDYLYKLSDKYERSNHYVKNFELIMSSIKQEYRDLKNAMKKRRSDTSYISYCLTFLLSLIKSVKEELEK